MSRQLAAIEVFDVAAYEAALPEFPLPPLGAGILLKTQSQGVTFQNGPWAVRSLIMRAQDGYFANNERLSYEFSGFTGR